MEHKSEDVLWDGHLLDGPGKGGGKSMDARHVQPKSLEEAVILQDS